MNKIRGAKAFHLGGKNRLVKFGSNQTGVFCDMRGMNLGDYLAFFQRAAKLEVDVCYTRDLVYSGLVEGARKSGEPVDFNEFDVADWLDEAGEETAVQIMEVYREANGPNPTAPKKGPHPKK